MDIWLELGLGTRLALGLGKGLALCFGFFSQYYPELFLPRNITVMRKQLRPIKFTCPKILFLKMIYYLSLQKQVKKYCVSNKCYVRGEVAK